MHGATIKILLCSLLYMFVAQYNEENPSKMEG